MRCGAVRVAVRCVARRQGRARTDKPDQARQAKAQSRRRGAARRILLAWAALLVALVTTLAHPSLARRSHPAAAAAAAATQMRCDVMRPEVKHARGWGDGERQAGGLALADLI